MCSTDKTLGPKIQTGMGGIPNKISPFLGVTGEDKQISDPLGNRNLFSTPGTSGVILPACAAVKISIFVGSMRASPPKLTKFFQKFLSNI